MKRPDKAVIRKKKKEKWIKAFGIVTTPLNDWLSKSNESPPELLVNFHSTYIFIMVKNCVKYNPIKELSKKYNKFMTELRSYHLTFAAGKYKQP